MEQLIFIGVVESPLRNLADCPLQENEGAPEATVKIAPEYRKAVEGLKIGSKVIILTWLHNGNRQTLATRPRNNPYAAMLGVFATRSPDRPNPIGIHNVEILAISEEEIKVSNLEVLNGTPVIDIKPVL